MNTNPSTIHTEALAHALEQLEQAKRTNQKLLAIAERAANNYCCLCCDSCLACDAVELLKELEL